MDIEETAAAGWLRRSTKYMEAGAAIGQAFAKEIATMVHTHAKNRLESLPEWPNVSLDDARDVYLDTVYWFDRDTITPERVGILTPYVLQNYVLLLFDTGEELRRPILEYTVQKAFRAMAIDALKEITSHVQGAMGDVVRKEIWEAKK